MGRAFWYAFCKRSISPVVAVEIYLYQICHLDLLSVTALQHNNSLQVKLLVDIDFLIKNENTASKQQYLSYNNGNLNSGIWTLLIGDFTIIWTMHRSQLNSHWMLLGAEWAFLKTHLLQHWRCSIVKSIS